MHSEGTNQSDLHVQSQESQGQKQDQNSSSAPTSPSQVVLNRSQNLENVLNPRAPIVQEAIAIGPRVQTIPSPRRSERNQSKERPDYRKLNKYGKQLIFY